MGTYKPLFMYVAPASIPQIVAHIQKYLEENPILSDPEAIAAVVSEYISEHPELIAVASVNGKTGAVVLTGADININATTETTIATQIANLAAMIADTGGDIDTINDNIEAIYGELDGETGIKARLTTIESDINDDNGIKDRLSGIEGEVNGAGGIDSRLTTVENDINAAQTGIKARLTDVETDVSSLKTRMTQAETDIDNNESSISTVNGILTALSADVQGLKNLDDWTTETNYCILPNGFKLCWGTTEVTANVQRPAGSSAAYAWYGGTTIAFPIRFDRMPFGLATIQDWASHWTGSITGVTTTGAQLRIGGDDNGSKDITWLVFGF